MAAPPPYGLGGQSEGRSRRSRRELDLRKDAVVITRMHREAARSLAGPHVRPMSHRWDDVCSGTHREGQALWKNRVSCTAVSPNECWPVYVAAWPSISISTRRCCPTLPSSKSQGRKGKS